MPNQVIMPQLGESVVEGTITKWLKTKGDLVQEFEPLLEVNTDKVDTEVPSPASGVLLDILVPEGTTVRAGELLAVIGQAGEVVELSKQIGEASALSEENLSKKTSKNIPAHIQKARIHPGHDQNLGFISPLVARIASERDVDLSQIDGTGQGGRITKKDVLNYLESRESINLSQPEAVSLPIIPGAKASSTVQSAQQSSLDNLPGEIIPFTPVRRAIAEHMVISKHISPHVTTVMEADLSRIVAHRQANKEAFSRSGVNLTFTAYFISAAVIALKTYPIVNSSYSEEGIILHNEINIGMATSLGEEGLIVPVIKNAADLSLLGLARTINDLANRARAKQLNPEEVKKGTFTITNHGISGSLFATPIINQPQCGILGVGVVQKRVVVIDDAIAIRPMAYLSLTFDHRILDGAIADYFLAKVVESLENWS